MWRVVLAGALLSALVAGGLTVAQEKAGKRSGAQGFIDSVEPCGAPLPR